MDEQQRRRVRIAGLEVEDLDRLGVTVLGSPGEVIAAIKPASALDSLMGSTLSAASLLQVHWWMPETQ